jgi:S1-C subfamily serine protease
VVHITGYMAHDGDRPYAEASGFFIDPNGFLITVADVFTDRENRRMCTRYEIKPSVGRVLEAKMFSVDALLNVAVLKTVEPGPYPAVDVTARARVRPGDRVLALVPAPLAGGISYASGQVLAKHRQSIYGAGFGDMLINTRIELPENAYGGPLLSERGEIIGVNTRNVHLTTPSNTDPSEAHALPISAAMIFYRAAQTDPTSERNWIGVDLRPLKPEEKEWVYKILGERAGLWVDFVWPDGPAAQADIAPGDVLFKIDGRSLGHLYELNTLLRATSTGSPARLAILRDGRASIQQVRTERRPAWAGFVR